MSTPVIALNGAFRGGMVAVPMPHYRLEQLTGYPALKRAQVLHALTAEEQDELERLERRRRLSVASERHLDQLWDRAHQLHAQRVAEPRSADNDLVVYAEEVGERMWARRRSGGSAEA